MGWSSGINHLSKFLREPVDLGAAPVVLLEGAAGERAGLAAADEAEAVVEQRLAKLFAAEGPKSATTTERGWFYLSLDLRTPPAPNAEDCSKELKLFGHGVNLAVLFKFHVLWILWNWSSSLQHKWSSSNSPWRRRRISEKFLAKRKRGSQMKQMSLSRQGILLEPK